MPSILRVVVDEAICTAQWARFQAYASGKGISTADPLYVGEHHPGMPDGQILNHLLDETTALLTTDRPFHNAALARGRASYYISEGRITGKPLSGIKPGPGVSAGHQNEAIRESYLPPQTEIRPLLMPDSQRQLKRLATKRRRIRNHFGGLLNLDQIAVTVSYSPLGREVLIGIRMRVSATTGQKALDASENYSRATIAVEDRDLAVICQSMVLLHQLMLESVKTLIFWDALQINEPPPAAADARGSFAPLYTALLASFPGLEFVPTPKGPFIDRLRRKLDDLAGHLTTNEIVASDLGKLAQQFASREPEP